MEGRLFCIWTVTLAPAGMSWSMRPHSFRKFLSAAARIHTKKCSSCSSPSKHGSKACEDQAAAYIGAD